VSNTAGSFALGPWQVNRVGYGAMQLAGDNEAIVNDSVGRQVIHRMAEPGDIAGAVVLVASDEAGWITGQSILANGGNAFSI
jgi:3-oxoacyl-[acyl-carrier protein] reductase